VVDDQVLRSEPPAEDVVDREVGDVVDRAPGDREHRYRKSPELRRQPAGDCRDVGEGIDRILEHRVQEAGLACGVVERVRQHRHVAALASYLLEAEGHGREERVGDLSDEETKDAAAAGA
jgi:hypothetical protein